MITVCAQRDCRKTNFWESVPRPGANRETKFSSCRQSSVISLRQGLDQCPKGVDLADIVDQSE